MGQGDGVAPRNIKAPPQWSQSGFQWRLNLSVLFLSANTVIPSLIHREPLMVCIFALCQLQTHLYQIFRVLDDLLYVCWEQKWSLSDRMGVLKDLIRNQSVRVVVTLYYGHIQTRLEILDLLRIAFHTILTVSPLSHMFMVFFLR